MTGPVWVPLAAVIAIHDRQIARHGGAPGMRDRSLLEAGCARPLNQAGYGTPTLPELAAAYAYGIATAPSFMPLLDGSVLSVATGWMVGPQGAIYPDGLAPDVTVTPSQVVEPLAMSTCASARSRMWM